MKIVLQTHLRGAEINLLMNYLKKRTEIAKDRNRWQNKAFQDSPGHSTRMTDWAWENATRWNEPPWVGGALEDGGRYTQIPCLSSLAGVQLSRGLLLLLLL